MVIKEKSMVIAEDLSNGVKLEMIRIPGGTFTMGSEKNDREKPPHEVTVPAFYIGKFQVTQAQWKAVMGNKLKPLFTGDNLPMDSVSWNDAKDFCQKLSQMTGKAYRLPTEAEWEYACRAGTTTEFAFGDSLSSDQANFDGRFPYGAARKGVYRVITTPVGSFAPNAWGLHDPFGEAMDGIYRKTTTPVGSFAPNAWGLHDMHGNVWEWCEDAWHGNYEGAPTDGSAWLGDGNLNFRILRGGSWVYDGRVCRSANRNGNVPNDRINVIGFRVAVSE